MTNLENKNTNKINNKIDSNMQNNVSNLTNKSNSIKVFALGGLGEIGKNCYCIEYLNQLFVIDAGILFPDEQLLGVDYVIPDFSYLKQNEDKIVGLFITHGHEDHIGGIPFLLRQVKIDKIYAAGVAIDLIKSKLNEHKNVKANIIEYTQDSILNFKDTAISFVRMNHSIPDSFGIVFKTSHGSIFHTGDFKVDFTPIGPESEYDKLTQLGQDKLLCLLADSTNAMTEGWTSSETTVKNSILELFSKIEGRVIVATFASNIYRVQQVVEASVQNNRKVAIFGRSMEKTIEIGQEIGYIKAPKNTFVTANALSGLKDNEVTILCTGSQGEPLAALSRIATGQHRHINLLPNDTVIFSSSPIPGNQDGVNKTINNLFRKGAKVIIHSPLTDTHTSGHAASGELRFIHTILKPKFFIPIHGEYRMQKIHSKISIDCGTKPENCFILENGDVLTLTKDEAAITGKVKAGEVYVDGAGIGDTSTQLIKERKKLSDDGMFALVINYSANDKTIITEPQVVSRGFIYMKENEKLTKKLVDLAKSVYGAELAKQKQFNVEQMQNAINEAISRTILKDTTRKPIVLTMLMEV